ncbi:MAG TPA: sulfite exporter TauE/SafE family protein [Vicinamibacterales bacterium]|nr:sulfite exporter TauE/SafE family protein [Vicinamibacterales bacterium]
MMPVVTGALAAIVFAAGVICGALGALLGLGGGVFLVPFFNLVLGFRFTAAAAISLTTVIATSSTVSAGRAGKQLINMRLGMLLEVATAAGSFLGGVTAQFIAQSVLQRLFGIVAAAVAVIMLTRLQRRNVILDPAADPGILGGRYYEAESGATVTYRVKRLPLAVVASFVAGNISSLLGIGGGIIKVPVLNAWCGVPLRAAAATSAFMIGVTATAGALIYYGRGQLEPALAALAVLGVQLGSWGGMRLGAAASAKWLKILMAIVLFIVSAMMFARGGR